MKKITSILVVSLVIASILVVGNMTKTETEIRLATDDLPIYIGMSIPRG